MATRKKEETFEGHKRSEIMNAVESNDIQNSLVGLEYYDSVRAPRMPPTEQAYVTREMLDKLMSALQCPICLSLMKDAVYVKFCMHRYCKECITKLYSKTYLQ